VKRFGTPLVGWVRWRDEKGKSLEYEQKEKRRQEALRASRPASEGLIFLHRQVKILCRRLHDLQSLTRGIR
jgi:hypothetical protein